MKALLAVVPLVASALVPAPPAHALADTCQGRPATIVGAPDQLVLDGTEGPDVIVTGGAGSVNALGGDDLVCVTGETFAVDAGPGDDVVDARARPGDGRTVLGGGADTYLGGPAHDDVDAGLDETGFYLDDDRDVIRTGPGGAWVHTGETETTNDDVVVLGRGGWIVDTNIVDFWGRQGPDGRLHFGDGKAVLHVGDASSGVPQWVVDNRERRISAAFAWLSWTGDVSEFDLQLREVPGGEGASMAFLGTRRAETVHVSGEVRRLDARLGRGADVVDLPGCATLTNSLVDLGRGFDTVQNGCDELVVRLDRGRVQPGVAVRGLESLEVDGDRVNVWGDEGRDRIQLAGCDGTVRGGDGADAIRVLRRLCGGPGATLYGGRGDDQLSGTPYADRLIGDRGRDVVDGKAGHDTCRAEVMLRCEGAA